jgi:hypothetical protein
MRILARPEHIEETQAEGAHAMHHAGHARVLLAAQLVGPIGGERLQPAVLGQGRTVGRAVHGRGGRVDHGNPAGPRGVQDVDGAGKIDPVRGRPRLGPALHRGDRGQWKQASTRFHGTPDDRRVGDAAHDEIRPGARLASEPVERSSRIRTSCPAAINAVQRCDPMNPQPPVTRTFAIQLPLLVSVACSASSWSTAGVQRSVRVKDTCRRMRSHLN